MTDLSRSYSRTGALTAYDAGVPSTLPPGNRWRPLVEDHRWGRHTPGYRLGCPVCERAARAAQVKP